MLTAEDRLRDDAVTVRKPMAQYHRSDSSAVGNTGLTLFEEATEEMRNLLRNPEHYAELVKRVRASLRPDDGAIEDRTW